MFYILYRLSNICLYLHYLLICFWAWFSAVCRSTPGAGGSLGTAGPPIEVASQSLEAWACPTPQPGIWADGGQLQPWASVTCLGTGQAEAMMGHQPVGGPALVGPKAGLWRAGDQPHCSIAGAGTDGPGGARVGSWAPGGGPGGSWSGQWGRARSALRALKQLTEMSPTTAEEEKRNFWGLGFERPVTRTNPIKLEGPRDLGWNGECQPSKRG